MSDANANNDAVKTSAPSIGSTSAAVEDRRRDPAMRALYQMSRTAGVGLQDYAAVNNLAVIGVFCAIIAALLYLLLWEIPIYPAFVVAGLVLSVIGFVQIARSNGTQTGKGIAAAAALLSLAVGVYAGVRGAMIVAEDKRHVAAIGAVVGNLGERVKAEEWQQGYDLMDDAFRKRVSVDEFQRQLGFTRAPQPGVALQGFAIKPESTRIVRDTAGNLTGETLLFLRFKDAAGKETEPPVPAILYPYGENWKIHDIPDLFPTQKRSR